jgi:O-antigen ligase
MSWRLYLWKQAWNDIVEKPLWGWGFGPKVVKTLPGGIVLTEETFISGPHNAYITVIFRLGFPLFVIFVGVPLCFLCRALTARQRVDATQVLALAVVGFSYFNAFFSLGFESPQNSVPAYVLMGLLLAPLWQIAGLTTDKESVPRHS